MLRCSDVVTTGWHTMKERACARRFHSPVISLKRVYTIRYGDANEYCLAEMFLWLQLWRVYSGVTRLRLLTLAVSCVFFICLHSPATFSSQLVYSTVINDQLNLLQEHIAMLTIEKSSRKKIVSDQKLMIF